MKKLILVLAIIVFLIVAPFVYSKAASYVQQLASPKGYITIKEEKGIDDIYIDGTRVGKTPIVNKALSSTSHMIKIVRDGVPSLYYQLQTTIAIQPNTNSVITLQLGPNQTYSFYNILTFQKTPTRSGVFVDIENASSDGTITLAGEGIKNNTYIELSPGTYHLVYKDSAHIGIDDEISVSAGYILNDRIHLFTRPI